MSRSHPIAASRRQSHFLLELLEDRSVPSVATAYVDDNWTLVTDNGAPGLSVGDEVRNDNDTINPGGISAIYGINAFGTVTSGPGITTPTSVVGSATINNAIANTTASGMVHVLEGTYDETVNINKALTLLGAEANVTPIAGGRGAESIITGPSGNDSISVESDNVTVNGFEVANQNYSITTNNHDAGGSGGTHQNVQISYNDISSTNANNAGIVLGFNVNTLTNSTFTNYTISHNLIDVSGGSALAAIGLGASAPAGGSAAYNELNISNNDISNANGYGIFAGGDPSVMSFNNAVIAQNKIHDTGDAGINIARAGNISISDNTFQNDHYTAMQVGIVGGSIVGNTFSQIQADSGVGFGDVIQLWGGQYNSSVSTNVNITNNIIHFNDVVGATAPTRALRLRPPISGSGIDGTTIHINDNAFINGGVITDGSAYAIVDQGDATKPVDASGNWWSTTSDAAIAALMSGPVDFTPFLNSGANSATTGFQGDFSVLNVTTLGSQTGTTGRIQEGVNLVTAGGTVNLEAGTYAEGNNAVSISKSLTISGPNATISPNSGSRVAEAVITDQGTNISPNAVLSIDAADLTVTVQGLKFDGTPSAMNAYNAHDTIALKKNIFTATHDPGMYFQTPTLTVDDNLFSNITGQTEDTIQVGGNGASDRANVTITNNVWSNVATAALNLSDASGTVSGNTFTHLKYYGALLANSSDVTVSGNKFDSITNPDPTGTPSWGAGVRFYTPTSNFGATITGNTFSNDYVGISVRPGDSITGLPISISGNTFTGNTYDIIQQGTGTLTPAGNNVFDGVTLSSATTPQMFAIEDKIVDGIDVAGYGLVQLRAGNVYVTPNSFFGSTTTPSLQRASDAASAGDTVNAEAGTYNGGVTLASNQTLNPASATSVTGIVNTGNLKLSAGGLTADVNGTTAGTDYDQIVATGTITLTGATLTVHSGALLPQGTSVVLIKNNGSHPVVGTFAGLPEGATVTTSLGQKLVISYVGGSGNDVVLSAPVPPSLPPPIIVPTTPVHLVAVGAGPRADSHVMVYNADGSLRFSFDAFPGFNGGVTVATGDVNGDGVDDIVVGAGMGASGGHVKVFNGATGAEIASFFAFDPAYLGAVSVAVGDVNNDSRGDIIVGSLNGTSHVKVFDFATGNTLMSFLAYPGFNGGVTVAAGNFDGVGGDDIITGVAGNGPEHVQVFNFAGQKLASFMANPGVTGPINVAAGKLNGNTMADILVAPATGNGLVQVFAGGTAAPVTSFDPGFTGNVNGLRIATGDVNNDNQPEILVAAGPGQNAVVKEFDVASQSFLKEITVFDGFSGGIFVG